MMQEKLIKSFLNKKTNLSKRVYGAETFYFQYSSLELEATFPFNFLAYLSELGLGKKEKYFV